MNTFHKSDEILREWNAIADRAVPPARAPRGAARQSGALKLGLVAGVAALLVSAVVVPGSMTGPVVVSPSQSSSAVVATASATPSSSAATSAQLPGENDPVGTGAVTDGVTENWKAMSWSQRDDITPLTGHILRWQGFQLMVGSDPTFSPAHTGTQIYFSDNGLTWKPVLRAPYQIQLAPAGPRVLAIASGNPVVDNDPATAPQTAWTSLDGETWTKIGTPSGVATIRSLAGTNVGFVALASAPVAGGGGESLATSADGLTWTSQAIPGGQIPVELQANNDAYFLLTLANGQSAVPAGVLWRSVDGKTWTQVASLGSGFAAAWINFGDHGMSIVTSNSWTTPGGQQLWYSTDDGRSWAQDQKGGPLGFAACTGQCAVNIDGQIASDGHRMVAVKNNGKAWTSDDGKTWTEISWNGGPSSDIGLITVTWRGVVVRTGSSEWWYGAAK